MSGEVVQQNLSNWREIKGGNIFNFEGAGDLLEGKLVDVRTGQGKYESIVYDIELPNGAIVSLFGSTVLDGRMKRVQIGEFVKIVFKGEKKSKGGRTYSDFQVFVREPENEGDV